MGKNWKSKKRSFKKRRGRVYTAKKIRRIAKQQIFKLTDVKTVVQELELKPSTATYIQLIQWRPLDPPIAAGSLSSYFRNSTIDNTNMWGIPGYPTRYIHASNVAQSIMVGNSILRTGYKIIARLRLGLFSGGAAPYNGVATGPAGITVLNPRFQANRIRISLIRSVNTVSDEALRAYLVYRAAQNQFNDPWDKKSVQVLHDRMVTMSPYKPIKTLVMKARGKKGKQRLRIMRASDDGALITNEITSRQPYIIVTTEPWYSWIDTSVTYQFIPYIDQMSVSTYYVDF